MSVTVSSFGEMSSPKPYIYDQGEMREVSARAVRPPPRNRLLSLSFCQALTMALSSFLQPKALPRDGCLCLEEEEEEEDDTSDVRLRFEDEFWRRRVPCGDGPLLLAPAELAEEEEEEDEEDEEEDEEEAEEDDALNASVLNSAESAAAGAFDRERDRARLRLRSLDRLLDIVSNFES